MQIFGYSGERLLAAVTYLIWASLYLFLSFAFLQPHLQASKSHKSDAAREKERKRKEHAQKILQKHGGKKPKASQIPDSTNVSAFQSLFKTRAQGFEISFKFRNAPPRPPVGPSFFGSDFEEKSQELSQYKPLNAVEANYRWKLHSEPDLGVTFAPSAMDPKSYTYVETTPPPLEKADLDLLEWKGSMGDTVAEAVKQSRDNARAAARLALLGKSPSQKLSVSATTSAAAKALDESSRRVYSRVLNEGMQSWMKKTTYVSNQHNRKVHDFKSLAKTKQDVEVDLEERQQDILQRRSMAAISTTFQDCKQTVTKHPTKKNVRPVAEMEVLPDMNHWGRTYTHIIVDKPPGGSDTARMDHAVVANVQKEDAAARMTCEVFAPSIASNEGSQGEPYEAIQQYELDLVPLKEEDMPHTNFCIWANPDSGKATYVPVSSRIQLSIGRPLHKENFKMNVSRRAMSDEEKTEFEQHLADMDADIDAKLNDGSGTNKMASALGGDGDDDDDESDDNEA
jgi:RNA polymerase II-associated factor 1